MYEKNVKNYFKWKKISLEYCREGIRNLDVLKKSQKVEYLKTTGKRREQLRGRYGMKTRG